jgi:protein phosphatase
MTLERARAVRISGEMPPRPHDDELDMFGLTDAGKVRAENQDHFMLATVHPEVVIHATSLPSPERLPLRGERMATAMLVADGVGGGSDGAEASQLAVETIARYVSHTLRCYHASGLHDDEDFLAALRAAALNAHEAVKAESVARRAPSRMATTLTLCIAVWPWAYVVQVGDSRCYFYQDGVLKQVTRDQTIAQDLVDQGALAPDRAAKSPLGHVLSSAIGAEEAVPVVTKLDIRRRGCVILLCSDGLTKHVSDAQIAETLRTMESSEQACHALLDMALDAGGTDNVTVLAGRARKE